MKNQKFKISIILPIFNVGNYLRAALDSIINQSFGFENLEVIMVDDCSTDDSGKIMDEYSEKYYNFIAIHLKENSRTAGKPRNIGIKRATSEYIMFLDSDDELMPDICECLYGISKNNDADVVTANALCIMGDKEVPDVTYKDKYNEIFPNKDLSQFKSFRVWGTLYKKSLIDKYNMKFIRASTNDDTHFVYNIFLHANKIIYLNDYFGVKYYERDAEEFVSLTHNISKFNILTTIGAFIEIVNMIDNSNVIKDYKYDPFIKRIYSRFVNHWDMDYADKKEIFEKILEYHKISKYTKRLPFQYKFMDFLLKHHMFHLLSFVQVIYSYVCNSRFSKKFLIPRIPRNVAETSYID